MSQQPDSQAHPADIESGIQPRGVLTHSLFDYYRFCARARWKWLAMSLEQRAWTPVLAVYFHIEPLPHHTPDMLPVMEKFFEASDDVAAGRMQEESDCIRRTGRARVPWAKAFLASLPALVLEGVTGSR